MDLGVVKGQDDAQRPDDPGCLPVPAGSGEPTELTLSPRLQSLIGYATGFADGAGTTYSAETLLLALVSDPAGVGAQILEAMGATARKVREAVERLPPRTS